VAGPATTLPDGGPPGPRRIHDLLGGAPADAFATAGGGERLTYGQLRVEVERYARALLALGVRRGDRVAMLTPPSVDFWRVLHATAAIGAIWIGVNPRYQRRDFEYLLGDASPCVILALSPFDGRDYIAELAPLVPPGARLVSLGDPSPLALDRAAFLAAGEAIADEALLAARAAVEPEDAAIIVYTSGTTGRPKGALLSHRAIVASALANAAWMGAENLARAVCAAPVNHVGAINNICMNILAAGGAIVFYPQVDIPALAELSRQVKPTYLVSSPTGFAMMLSHPAGVSARLGSTKLIVFGGATTALSTLETIAPSGAALSSVYGQSETCGIITHTRLDDPLEAHAATIGRPLAGAQLRIAGPDGAALAAGESGEIQIRAPYVMSGYFNNPAATAEAFTPEGFLRTGDLGRVRADGQLVFVGRLKEMFKSGGYNIYPVEIEQAICEHPAVALAAVVPVPHETFQEVGHAFVQPKPEAQLDLDALKAFLKGRIANYKVPKSFEIDLDLPRLPNNKLDKMALQDRAKRQRA
jgi:acyl-CoA synthetase (AMP-forming)/AMP-acid ligase II